MSKLNITMRREQKTWNRKTQTKSKVLSCVCENQNCPKNSMIICESRQTEDYEEQTKLVKS